MEIPYLESDRLYIETGQQNVSTEVFLLDNWSMGRFDLGS